jgi:DNA polymerase-3 subunit delta
MNKLFHGKETYISLRNAKREITELTSKKSVEKFSIEGDKVDIEELSDTLNTSSLFTPERVIFLKRPYRNKKRKELIPFLLEFLEKDNKNTHLIIWEDQKIKSNTKYYKFFKENKCLDEAPELNKRTFATWAKEELKEQNITLDNSLVKLLAERTNYSAESFANELQKLKLTGKRVFKKEDITENTEDTLEYDIWKLIDSINSQSNMSLRLGILEKILSQEVDVNYIISMLARNLRLTVQIKELIEKKNNSREIASILRIPPFTVPQMQRIAKEYSYEKISLIYEKLSSLDYEIKRGRIEPQLGLTLLITKF